MSRLVFNTDNRIQKYKNQGPNVTLRVNRGQKIKKSKNSFSSHVDQNHMNLRTRSASVQRWTVNHKKPKKLTRFSPQVERDSRKSNNSDQIITKLTLKFFLKNKTLSYHKLQTLT